MYLKIDASEDRYKQSSETEDGVELRGQMLSDEELQEERTTSSACLGRVGIGRRSAWGIVIAGALCVAAIIGVRSLARSRSGGARSDRVRVDVLATSMPNPAGTAWKKIDHMVVDNEGQELSSFFTQSLDDCYWRCGNTTACNSVTICDVANGVQCHLKTSVLNTMTPRQPNSYCHSAFPTTDPYVPRDVNLTLPSQAPELTFYMYRAKGGNSNYPLENVDTASIGAVMWYLHNEVIYVCDGGGYLSSGKFGDRKFQIDKIMRYKVSIKTSTPLWKKGMNFSVFKAFDFGECTGPHRGTQEYGEGTGLLSYGEWLQYGFTPGCVYMGYSPMDQPDFLSAKDYPNAIWFSLPGPCPSYNFKEKSETCKSDLPGGLCDSVTGQGNCTYSVENAGWIDLDELVGITPRWPDRATFCRECAPSDGSGAAEGTITSGGGCGMDFWGPNINDRVRNQQRVDAAIAAFEKKYPDSVREGDLMTPFCDYNPEAYGWFR